MVGVYAGGWVGMKLPEGGWERNADQTDRSDKSNGNSVSTEVWEV